MVKFKISNQMKLELESAVYSMADQFWTGYKGGCWLFDTEGEFWYPQEKAVTLENPYNYFSGKLRSRSAGAALSLMAGSHLSMKYFERNTDLSEAWAEYYHTLREEVLSSFSDEDLSQIFRFLD